MNNSGIALSLKLLEIFTPLFDRMEKQNVALNAEAFTEAAYQHYKTLTVYDKKAVFDFNRRFRAKDEVKQPTFQPKFDPMSLKLSEKRRPPGENITEIFERERKDSDSRLVMMKKELELKEINGCTFSPSIIRATSMQTAVPPPRYSLSSMRVSRDLSAVHSRQINSTFTGTGGANEVSGTGGAVGN